MTNEVYLLKVLYGFVNDELEKLGYYPANNDWEFNGKKWDDMVEEISNAILVYMPDNLYKYIRTYNLNYE